MSLDLALIGESRATPCSCVSCGHEHWREEHEVFHTENITHNLIPMFAAAGLYKILWHGDHLVAGEQVAALEAGLRDMERRPDHYRRIESPDGWGRYTNAVPWLRRVIAACRAHPEATLRCSR